MVKHTLKIHGVEFLEVKSSAIYVEFPLALNLTWPNIVYP